MRGINRTIDEHKSKAIDLMRQIARGHNDINGLKITQENLHHHASAWKYARRRSMPRWRSLKRK